MRATGTDGPGEPSRGNGSCLNESNRRIKPESRCSKCPPCKHQYQKAFLFEWGIKGARIHICSACTLAFPNTHFYPNWWHMPEHTHTHLPTYPSTNPWKVLITGEGDVMCCAIFRDIHISWRREALLLSNLPREAVNTSWPPREASSWVWRLLEPRGPLVPTAATSLSLSLSNTRIQNPARAYMKAHKSANAHACSGAPTSLQLRSYVRARAVSHGPSDH